MDSTKSSAFSRLYRRIRLKKDPAASTDESHTENQLPPPSPPPPPYTGRPLTTLPLEIQEQILIDLSSKISHQYSTASVLNTFNVQAVHPIWRQVFHAHPKILKQYYHILCDPFNPHPNFKLPPPKRDHVNTYIHLVFVSHMLQAVIHGTECQMDCYTEWHGAPVSGDHDSTGIMSGNLLGDIEDPVLKHGLLGAKMFMLFHHTSPPMRARGISDEPRRLADVKEFVIKEDGEEDEKILKRKREAFDQVKKRIGQVVFETHLMLPGGWLDLKKPPEWDIIVEEIKGEGAAGGIENWVGITIFEFLEWIRRYVKREVPREMMARTEKILFTVGQDVGTGVVKVRLRFVTR